jgi:transposase
MKIKAKIRERRREGATAAAIASEFGVSKRSVHRAIAEPVKKERKRGRPTLMSRHERKVFVSKAREAPTESAKKIANSAGVSISSFTAQRELRRNSFRYSRVRVTELLKDEHREKRITFAENHVSWPQEKWDRVVFSDEKKWNLSGSDNYVSLWKENQKTYRIEVEKKLRRGIMVWGAIAASGAIVLVRIYGKLNSARYCEMLENGLFNESQEVLPQNFIFMQDNAPVHVSQETKSMLAEKNIEVLEWPPYSPDLNPIENVWGIISREVYKDQKSYRSEDELWEAVGKAWDNIPEETL